MGDLTKEQFDSLLAWLDSDRDAAALKYAKIQLRIIRIFTCRGCPEAEFLADTTFDRVAAKVESLVQTYVGDPALYFCGVAQNVHKEYLRTRSRTTDIQPVVLLATVSEEREREFECFDACMGQLPEENAQLLMRYYEGEKQSKIKNRKLLAEGLGITLDALRIRAHRIRRELRKCVLHCLDEAPAH
ncbi:MAG TPA: hypothetical protein VGO68_00900 [Pyrinomonadaceae bacterium]|jgi:DNA-directed RNA polymerase specialized sigma24 family protein|nr:hypothetical protein [Pyrinomonadaceae bacterium]